MITLEELADLATAAEMDAVHATARAARWREHLIGSVERLRAQVGGAVTRVVSATPRLATLSLDGDGLPPTALIRDPAAFGSWLAQRDPKLVETFVSVPADRLAEVLDILSFHGIQATAKVSPRPESGQWLVDHAIVCGTKDGGWECRYRTAAGDVEEIDGTSARKSSPRWVLRVDHAVKKETVEGARQLAEAEIAAAERPEDIPTLTPDDVDHGTDDPAPVDAHFAARTAAGTDATETGDQLAPGVLELMKPVLRSGGHSTPGRECVRAVIDAVDAASAVGDPVVKVAASHRRYVAAHLDDPDVMSAIHDHLHSMAFTPFYRIVYTQRMSDGLSKPAEMRRMELVNWCANLSLPTSGSRDQVLKRLNKYFRSQP